jgi:hypothetical protein
VGIQTLRWGVLAASFCIVGAVIAGEAPTDTFEDQNGAYSFEYPSYMFKAFEFADGTGDETGVSANFDDKGHFGIELRSIDPRGVKEVTDATYKNYVDQYKSDFAPNFRMKFVSEKKTELLGKPAADMTFEEKISFPSGPLIITKRYIATVAGGRDYFLACDYRTDQAAAFAASCDHAASSLKLRK